MIPQAELLLMATGLLKLPDRDAIRATKSLEKELDSALREAIHRDNQGRLYSIKVPLNYFDRLYKFVPDYAEVINKLGPELGSEFQVAQSSAAMVMSRDYPRTTIDSVLGPRPVDPSVIDLSLYLIRADTVEDYQRLIHDFAAGVLVPEQVTTYKEVYPGGYDFLLTVLQDELARSAAKDPNWMPPLWLSDNIKILRQEKLGTFVQLDAGKAIPQTSTPSKLQLDDLVKAAEV